MGAQILKKSMAKPGLLGCKNGKGLQELQSWHFLVARTPRPQKIEFPNTAYLWVNYHIIMRKQKQTVLGRIWRWYHHIPYHVHNSQNYSLTTAMSLRITGLLFSKTLRSWCPAPAEIKHLGLPKCPRFLCEKACRCDPWKKPLETYIPQVSHTSTIWCVFLKGGGTSSHHPYFSRIFHHRPASLGILHFRKPPYHDKSLLTIINHH